MYVCVQMGGWYRSSTGCIKHISSLCPPVPAEVGSMECECWETSSGTLPQGTHSTSQVPHGYKASRECASSPLLHCSDLTWSFSDPNLLASCAVDSYVHVWDIRDVKRPKTSFKAVGESAMSAVCQLSVSALLLAIQFLLVCVSVSTTLHIVHL